MSAPASSGSSGKLPTDIVGNTTSPAGSAGGAIPKETLGEKMGITMPASTKIVDTEREGDHVVPNSDVSGTAGKGGDFVHKEVQGHDVAKGRLETNAEREDREAFGLKEPVAADRKHAEA
ncbi:uncharacterized protein JCM6883_007319 [Sporobolomyces salmoneus]|uniref:uncharacterized protein n=1 Tax=Sporobolomyces salmoneus TaxID=183962 RepID=UPI003173DB53